MTYVRIWGIEMKKSSSVLTVAAVIGLSALSAAPASAVTPAFPNCPAAAAVGVYNIPVGAPGYGPHLDSDNDGIGCEKAGVAYAPAQTTQQVRRVPVGGANTGVAQETNGMGVLALGGGLVLAAAGGTFVVRRRAAKA
jgi:Excalibur calcium-binding domain